MPGLPKSSLDGARQTVLLPSSRGAPSRASAKYRIDRGEQLDAVGVW